MAEKEGSGKSKEMLDAAQYREAVNAMERGEVKAKTKVAFYKLSKVDFAEYDSEGAVLLLKERVKEDDDDAMWMLGLCYEYGIGIEQDISQAEELYIRCLQCHMTGNTVGSFLLNNWSGHGSGKFKIIEQSTCLLAKY